MPGVASTRTETVLRWSPRGLLESPDEPAGALLVADSWLVRDGTVRGLDAHWSRFGGCCEQLGLAPIELARFRAAVTASLPRGPGRWFPRVEAVDAEQGAPRLRLRLRRAPAPSLAVRVAVAAHGDPRTRPLCKGPDLDALIALRAQTIAAGAGELLLCDDDGRLIEGALSSLLWWEDGALCTTPDEHTLPGVTRALLLDIARRRGVEVRVRAPRAEQLEGLETWLTSALHGIRVVSAWVAPRVAAGAGQRAPAWREELDRDG